MAQELDFENEANNAERCAKELSHLKYVRVPKVHWDKTTKVCLPDWDIIWFYIRIGSVLLSVSLSHLITFISYQREVDSLCL